MSSGGDASPVYGKQFKSSIQSDVGGVTRDSIHSPFRTTGVAAMRHTSDARAFAGARGSSQFPAIGARNMSGVDNRPMTVSPLHNGFEESGHKVEVSAGTLDALEHLRSKYNEAAQDVENEVERRMFDRWLLAKAKHPQRREEKRSDVAALMAGDPVP